MKVIKVTALVLVLLFTYLIITGDFKNGNQEPVKTVSLLKIKGLGFNSTPNQVVNTLGSPNKTNVKSVIEKEAINNKPVGQENVLIDSGIDADRCLSYNTSQKDTWMLCFKNNQLISKARLAQVGKPRLAIKS